MIFSSLLFLCLFLPVVLGLCYILPARYRNLLLLAASLLFYAWGEPRYVVIMLFSTVFDYSNGRVIEWAEEHDRKKLKSLVLILSVIGNLGILGFFKYTDFALTNINRLFGGGFSLLGLALPIGISFYTFQTMSYTIDVYRGKVKAQKNILDFGMYVCLFPQLIAGPIVRYTDIAGEIRDRKVDSDRVYSGMIRFAKGLGKKVLLANPAGALWEEISAISQTVEGGAGLITTTGAMPMVTAWLGALMFTFQIYFDFSGYSDMAIGLGEMLGFTFPENFDHPYESRSVTEFWRRWHMTLGTWFREYLYIPLGGNRCGAFRQVLNLLIVWSLTGFWHGAEWNFLLWGLYYFVLLLLEKLVFKKLLSHLPAVLSHLLTMVLVIFGWVIFACDDLSLLISYLSSMIGLHGIADSMSAYYLSTHGILLLLLAVGSTTIPTKLWKKVKDRLHLNETGELVVKTLYMVGMFALGILFLVGDSYNPFLYFRF